MGGHPAATPPSGAPPTPAGPPAEEKPRPLPLELLSWTKGNLGPETTLRVRAESAEALQWRVLAGFTAAGFPPAEAGSANVAADGAHGVWFGERASSTDPETRKTYVAAGFVAIVLGVTAIATVGATWPAVLRLPTPEPSIALFAALVPFVAAYVLLTGGIYYESDVVRVRGDLEGEAGSGRWKVRVACARARSENDVTKRRKVRSYRALVEPQPQEKLLDQLELFLGAVERSPPRSDAPG